MNTRLCPQCNKELKHTQAGNCQTAERLKRLCVSCAQKKLCGGVSPFSGKKHSESAKQKLREAGKKTWDNFSPEYKQITAQRFKKVRAAREGLGTLNDIWLLKGEAYAAEKWRELKKKRSAQMTGEGNNMYGKPAPKGAGNGWKGHLDGRYCRSLREALFIETALRNIPFESGEKAKYRISYINPLGQTANYFPDFVTKDLIIECKPRRLWKTPLIKSKARAACKFARAIGKRYKLVDIAIDPKLVAQLIESGRWKFDARYGERYKKFLAVT